MNHLQHSLMTIGLISIFSCLSAFPVLGQGNKEITIEDVFGKNAFQVKNIPGFNMMKNGEDFTRMDDDNSTINVYRIRDGKKIKTLYHHDVEHLGRLSKYEFSSDEQKLLLFSNIQPIYRRSARYNVSVYDLQTNTITPIDEAPILHATFDPTGNRVAFVKGNNLYYKDLKTGTTHQITTDGEENKIINGNCDWVYEEEFAFTRAFQWSPDGAYIAFYRFDETAVPQYTLPFYEDGTDYPVPYTYKYPKAGEENSQVSIHIYRLADQTSQEAQIGSENDQYIPRIQWTPTGNNLCIFRMNRLQNKLELLFQNANGGPAKAVYTETNKYYIDVNNALTPNNNLTFLKDGHSLIINSERSGYNHLYKWDWKNEKLTPITKGNWDIDQLIGVDQKSGKVYYTAAKRTATQRELYAINLNGSQDKCLTPEEGFHEITGLNGNHYFLDGFSTANQVPVYRLLDQNGKVVRVLEKNQELADKMKDYKMSPVEFFNLTNPDGVALNAYRILPPNFDSSKKYPILMYQYSGPGSQQVLDKFPTGQFFWHEMMAQKGYIIVCVDGTGTGMRGWEFQNKTYLNLGDYESRDQIAAAKYLATLPYVDADRIGIWGWSYGGFMSATCIFKGADVFKTAVSVAPVTNWRYYDDIYTERYMRRPIDNPKGYDENAPETMTHLLKGNLLIIHGLADDNVHFQNSAMMVKHLIENGKQFDVAYYPNKNHSIAGGNTRVQLFTKITQYILEKL